MKAMLKVSKFIKLTANHDTGYRYINKNTSEAL